MGKLLDSEDEIKRKYQADFWGDIVGARPSFGTISEAQLLLVMDGRYNDLGFGATAFVKLFYPLIWFFKIGGVRTRGNMVESIRQ
jgi:hypothetical protein